MLKAALGDAVLVSGGGDANLRRERAFLDALSPTGVADQQRMAAGDFRDALAKRCPVHLRNRSRRHRVFVEGFKNMIKRIAVHSF